MRDGIQSLRFADDHEAIHLPAVNLKLFLIKTMSQIRRVLVGGNVPFDAERCVGESGRESRPRYLRQCGVGSAGGVDLRRRGPGGGKAGRPCELAVQVVEAVVLEIDHHHVLESVDVWTDDPAAAVPRLARGGRG